MTNMHFFVCTTLVLLASLQLAFLLPVRNPEDAKRIDTREVANETDNSSACFDADAHKVDIQCRVNATSLEEQKAAQDSLWTGLQYLAIYSQSLWSPDACLGIIPVIDNPLQTSFDYSTTEAKKANQYMANWAGVLRAYGDYIITILDTNLTDEEQEKAITLHKIITGVLYNYKDMLEPFCSCNATEECASFIPATPQEEVDCNGLSKVGYYLGYQVSIKASAMWVNWQLWQSQGQYFPPPSVTVTEWQEKYLS